MAVSTFKEYLDLHNLQFEILETSADTHTAQQAAEVHGVPVSNIVKSLLLCSELEGGKRFFLVLTPGDVRLDIEKWSRKLTISPLRMANADEVKSTTGYSIGGVPPFGHTSKIETHIEDGFDGDIELVAAAGSANSVFKISLNQLKEIVA